MEREKVTAAAIRVSGQVFTASNHGEAFNDAEHALGYIPRGDAEDGFVTSSGRFVDRETAYDIAEDAGQVPQNDNGEMMHYHLYDD